MVGGTRKIYIHFEPFTRSREIIEIVDTARTIERVVVIPCRERCYAEYDPVTDSHYRRCVYVCADGAMFPAR